MADTVLRRLEREEAAGNITREELEQALCRYEGCEPVHVLDEDTVALPARISVFVCRRCLAPRIEWQKPANLPRCELCRSPVLMRKAGVCLDCGNKLTMPKEEPPQPGHVMTGRTASGARIHAAMRLPKAGSRTKIRSLCSEVLVDASLEVGRPTCGTCCKRLTTARRRIQEEHDRMARQTTSAITVLLIASTDRWARQWIAQQATDFEGVRFVRATHARHLMGQSPATTYYHCIGGPPTGVRASNVLAECERRGIPGWDPDQHRRRDS